MPQLNDLVGQNSGGLPDRISALGSDAEGGQATQDLVQQLTQLQQQQDDLTTAAQGVEPTGMGSVQGILASLSALTGAASGDTNAAATGRAGLQNFIQSSEADAAKQQADLLATRDALAKGMDAKRKQLITMLQTQPDMFIDPETGQSTIDPRVLGYASTGILIPINPAVNYQLKQKTARQNAQVEMGLAAMNGDTPEQRQAGASMIQSALGINLSDEFLSSLATSDDSAIWERIHSNPSITTGSSLAAHVYALENGLSIRDSAEVVGMLTPDASRGSGGQKFTSDDRFQNLLAQWNEAVAAAGGAYSDLGPREQISAVFSDRPADEAFLLQKMDMDDPFGNGVPMKAHLDNVRSVGEWMVKLFDMSKGQSKFFKDRGITNTAQIWEHAGQIAGEMMPIIEQEMRDNASANVGTAYNLLTTLYAGTEANQAQYAEGASKARGVVEQLKKQHTKNGTFDVQGFNDAVKNILVQE